jgi:hypothetical protein
MYCDSHYTIIYSSRTWMIDATNINPPKLDRLLSQFDPVHISQSYLPKINFNIINLLVFHELPSQSSMCICFPHQSYIPSPL